MRRPERNPRKLPPGLKRLVKACGWYAMERHHGVWYLWLTRTGDEITFKNLTAALIRTRLYRLAGREAAAHLRIAERIERAADACYPPAPGKNRKDGR